MSQQVQIKLLSFKAVIPTKADVGSAGYDLYAALDEPITIAPGQRALIPTDISTSFPSNLYLRIAPRSGLAYKNGVDVLAGVIDSSFTGNIGVILHNTDTVKSFTVNPGDRIAQGIFESCTSVEFTTVTELTETARGSGGFGSSGV